MYLEKEWENGVLSRTKVLHGFERAKHDVQDLESEINLFERTTEGNLDGIF